MGKIKIEKNIPIPPKGAKYPFAEMAVGDSFLAEGVSIGVFCSAKAYFKKNISPEWRFVTRKEDGGIRCWRVK